MRILIHIMGMQGDIVISRTPERIRFDTSICPVSDKINIIQFEAKPVGGGKANDFYIGLDQSRHWQAQGAFPNNFFAGTYGIRGWSFGGRATFQP